MGRGCPGRPPHTLTRECYRGIGSSPTAQGSALPASGCSHFLGSPQALETWGQMRLLLLLGPHVQTPWLPAPHGSASPRRRLRHSRAQPEPRPQGTWDPAVGSAWMCLCLSCQQEQCRNIPRMQLKDRPSSFKWQNKYWSPGSRPRPPREDAPTAVDRILLSHCFLPPSGFS